MPLKGINRYSSGISFGSSFRFLGSFLDVLLLLLLLATHCQNPPKIQTKKAHTQWQTRTHNIEWRRTYTRMGCATNVANAVGLAQLPVPVLAAVCAPRALVYRPINENGMEQWQEKPLNIA